MIRIYVKGEPKAAQTQAMARGIKLEFVAMFAGPLTTHSVWLAREEHAAAVAEWFREGGIKAPEGGFPPGTLLMFRHLERYEPCDAEVRWAQRLPSKWPGYVHTLDRAIEGKPSMYVVEEPTYRSFWI